MYPDSPEYLEYAFPAPQGVFEKPGDNTIRPNYPARPFAMSLPLFARSLAMSTTAPGTFARGQWDLLFIPGAHPDSYLLNGVRGLPGQTPYVPRQSFYEGG